MPERQDPIDELEHRLRRFPAERYPVQHATTRFHLGGTLADAGRLVEAEAALTTAARLFERSRLGPEHAKAMNALGAVLRLAGRLDEAARALARAAAAFEACELTAERGAARFNLGLVERDAGKLSAAVECFEDARGLLEQGGVPAQAGAASRELGATLLTAGDLERAREALERAVELASAARDQPGLGAAANALGLAELAAAHLREALEALETALAAHPRSVRPAEYAMVKANLALAYERTGEAPRARLAARQALAVGAAAEAVRAQGTGVVERLGDERGDVLRVLDDEERDRWPAVVREELARWVDVRPGERRDEAGAWIDGQLARAELGSELAEAWVGALLELPPQALRTVVESTVEALGHRGADARERFRSETSMAMARFHVPQLLRLRDSFNRIAEELGEEAAWS